MSDPGENSTNPAARRTAFDRSSQWLKWLGEVREGFLVFVGTVYILGYGAR